MLLKEVLRGVVKASYRLRNVEAGKSEITGQIGGPHARESATKLTGVQYPKPKVLFPLRSQRGNIPFGNRKSCSKSRFAALQSDNSQGLR